jgi:YD repeat-containing protein
MKSTYPLLFLSIIFDPVFSQQVSPWTAPSPASYSFSRYGEIPVSHYTGIPDISIPIAALREHDVETRISLSYHGGGIKVDEIASWVGLGWNLNAGGCISRTIRGRPECPDEATFMNPPRVDIGFPEPDRPDGSFSDLTWLESAGGPNIDVEPDIFICNFNGRCARFVFDENGQVRFFNHQDWDVKFLLSNPDDPSKYYESKFIITTEDGTKYEFNSRDMLYLNYVTAPCAWYLTKIESPAGNSIIFEYSSFRVQHYTHARTSAVAMQNTMAYSDAFDFPVTEGFSGRSEIFLTKIKSDNSGWIEFKVNPVREKRRKDYNNSDNYPLDEIIIHDKNGIAIKIIKFITSYFIAPDFTPGQYTNYYIYPYTNLQHLRYRLRLDAVQEYSGDRQKWIPPYIFKYYTDINQSLYNLPYRLSPEQDHWGYFNNSDNTSLIPNIDWYEEPGYWLDLIMNISGDFNYSFRAITGGGNREPDNESMKACTLNKIYYPTGGYTEFTFESNDYSIANNTSCGGLRIKSIKNFSESGIKVREKEYFYKDFNPATKEISANSSGRLIDHPKDYYLTSGKVECFDIFSPESCDLANDLGNPSPSFCFYNDGIHGTYNIIYNVSAMPVMPMGNAYNLPLGYHSVIEKEQGNGYSVYFYTGPSDYPNYNDPDDLDPSLYNLNLFKTQYSTSTSSGGWSGWSYLMQREEIKSSEWPYLHPYESDWQRGLLTNVYHYSNLNMLVSSKVNDYYFENLHNTPGYSVKKLNYASTEFIHGRYLIPSGWTALKKQTSYQYDSNGKIADIQEFRYEGSGHKMLTTLITYNSRGDSIIKTMSYPKDLPSGINTSAATLDSMICHNIINPVIREEIRLNGRDFLSGTINNFKIENNLIRPSDVRIATTNELYEIREKFNRFDSNGNLIEHYKMADNDNVNLITSYCWGYGNTLPVIKAENVDYTTLTTEIANSLPGGFASLDALLISITSFPDNNWNTFNQNLRSRQSLLKAFITTYTYKPQAGMNSQTDPNGVITCYEYDDFGRLKCVRNDDGNILKTFEYHYKH